MSKKAIPLNTIISILKNLVHFVTEYSRRGYHDCSVRHYAPDLPHVESNRFLDCNSDAIRICSIIEIMILLQITTKAIIVIVIILLLSVTIISNNGNTCCLVVLFTNMSLYLCAERGCPAGGVVGGAVPRPHHPHTQRPRPAGQVHV